MVTNSSVTHLPHCLRNYILLTIHYVNTFKYMSMFKYLSVPNSLSSAFKYTFTPRLQETYNVLNK